MQSDLSIDQSRIPNYRDTYLGERMFRDVPVASEVLERPEQLYTCRNHIDCGRQMLSRGIPEGWYLIRKCVKQEGNLITIALVCSLPCLIQDVARGVSHDLRNTHADLDKCRADHVD